MFIERAPKPLKKIIFLFKPCWNYFTDFTSKAKYNKCTYFELNLLGKKVYVTNHSNTINLYTIIYTNIFSNRYFFGKNIDKVYIF